MRRLLLGAVLLIMACGGAATLPAPSQPSVTRTAPTGTIDVNDMMGAFPAATFFVVTDEGVRAIALLNHTSRYTIPTSPGAVQVATGNGQLYIADDLSEGTRLRWIDQASGAVLATWIERSRWLVSTPRSGHGALAVEPATGRVLALYADGEKRVVEAYDASLRPLGKRFEALCGDRVLAATARVVVPCFAAGEVVISDNGAKPLAINAGLGTLVAAAISSDGTALVGRDDGTLGWILAATTTVVKIEPFRPARLVPDGIASPEPQKFAVALATGDREVGVSETRSTQRYISFPAKEAPAGGILAQGQFAYWTDGVNAKHIDLQQGFMETMAAIGGRRVQAGAVGN